MGARSQLLKRDEVAERLAHLLSVDRNHVIVHPVTGRIVTAGGRALRDLAFVMRKHQIHTAAMDIELFAQVAGAHRRTLHVPAGKTVAPRRRPAHDVFRSRLFPQREIERIALIALPVQVARIGHHVFQYAAGELPVTELPVISFDVEINGAVADIGVTAIQNRPHHRDLLDDMARSARFDARRQDVQLTHRIVITVGIVLSHLHRFELFEPGFLADLVLAFVGVVLKMSHVGDIAHVTHLVTGRPQVAEQQVERNGRTGVSQVRIAVNGRAADIKSHERSFQRHEGLFFACQGIMDRQIRFHGCVF